MINSDADNGAASHALHVQNISGQHTFVLNLNSDNHALSDMLYVQNVGETGKTGGKPQNLHIISNGKRGLSPPSPVGSQSIGKTQLLRRVKSLFQTDRDHLVAHAVLS